MQGAATPDKYRYQKMISEDEVLKYQFIPRVSLKDDGPTGQTTGQRGSDPSAYRVSKRWRADGSDDGLERKWPVGRRLTRRRIGSLKQGIITYYRILNPKRLKKTWLLLSSSNAHITKYSYRTATITVKIKIKHKYQKIVMYTID